MPSERPRDQESTRAQNGCAGEPVALETPYLWAVEELVPTVGGDSPCAHDLAIARTACAGGGTGNPAYAKGVDHDERANRQHHQRSEWSNRTNHRSSHSEGRAGPLQTGPDEGVSDTSQPRRDCAQSGGELATIRIVRVAASGRGLRFHKAADRRLRPAVTGVPGGIAGPASGEGGR